MEDPDRDWKPSRRPQSTIAQNFMSELDDLFKMDSGLDLLDKNVHQKKQAVSTQTQELQALEARLRETEERLQQAKTSPPRRSDSQRRMPLRGAFPDADKARIGDENSPLSKTQARGKAQVAKDISGALSETPSSSNSAEYILVDRPRTAQSQQSEKA
ncbi:hypothetical protein P154DRAFT_554961 [Amniculicola lignicola CBS 123094]|uniref:Uncharacterized protein n=1 Tax=Amniculicola lignicola CBS 123094 TaxID=1392246 RepID=A0A6A5WNH6_9PLEO|nr:hypothetical protein P154DRAFT_554961 [Amniculicola lignicola CBS 123094]